MSDLHTCLQGIYPASRGVAPAPPRPTIVLVERHSRRLLKNNVEVRKFVCYSAMSFACVYWPNASVDEAFWCAIDIFFFPDLQELSCFIYETFSATSVSAKQRKPSARDCCRCSDSKASAWRNYCQNRELRRYSLG